MNWLYRLSNRRSWVTAVGLLGMATALSVPVDAAAQIATTSRITSPVIVATPAQMTQGALSGTQLDGPLSTFVTSTSRYWISSQWRHSGGITHSFNQGGLDNPYGATLWTKETCNRNSANYCINGVNTAFTQIGPSDVANLWFVNLYQPNPNAGNLLAFVHEENVGHSGNTPTNVQGRTRIGLAWSSDHGNTWNYLGRIISPNGDAQPLNIQGVPYLVKDGYFYIYFIDSTDGTPEHIGIAVARAPVADVIAAAAAGSLGSNLWKKYDGSGFTQAGLGGQPSAIAPWGITHTQAVHSSYNGKFYLPLTFMTWSDGQGGRVNSSIKLYESTDAIHWSAQPAMVVADESPSTLKPDAGYQYCSVADRDGATNADVGQYFYLYCMKDPTMLATQFGIYRWQINLGPSVDSFRQSDDFSSSQSGYWRYLFGNGSTLSNMAWQSSYWNGTDAWARIYRDSMHTANTQMPVLHWIAPKNGTVRVEATVRDADIQCGDGVNVSVVHNGTEIYAAAIDNADTVGKSINQSVNVAAGDSVSFILAPKADNFCDTTRWDPSIRYY